MVYASHDRFRSAQIASGIHASITGSEKGDMELRDMNEKEMRELDAWIAENVMEWRLRRGNLNFNSPNVSTTDCIYISGKRPDVRLWNGNESRSWRPTQSSIDAMDVLKKCAEKIDDTDGELNCIQIQFWNGQWHVMDFNQDNKPNTAQTLELAICKFAKELFSK